ncbi:hypothetical protein JXM67_15440 [candidate division WOR-3 bacterium]|nr:hypothetical protein [candidate division WOR-3 bacterium]
MNRSLSIFLGLGLLVLASSQCKKTDEVPVIKETARNYWDALFRGQTRAAYEMLDSESQGFIVFPDYARKVGLYPSSIKEVRDYWEVYYPLTEIQIQSATFDRKTKTAVVSLVLTQPDPKWFPDDAVAEAESLGLEEGEKGRFVLRAMTEALREGTVPVVKIAENTRLIKEEDEWRIVFTR